MDKSRQHPREALTRLFAEYGMVLVLLALCVLLSITTYNEQYPTGEAAAAQLAERIERLGDSELSVLVAARAHEEGVRFAEHLATALEETGISAVEVVTGEPRDARQTLQRLADNGQQLDVIAGNQVTAGWLVFSDLEADFPQLGNPQVLQPAGYWWPDFLTRENLLNVADQIAVIAIIAIGMTMVIITAGIDLSVGSLVALSAVATALLIRDVAGAADANVPGMVLACLGGVLLCGAVGAFSGVMITAFSIPPFIVTLAMMLVASGIAYMLSGGESVYQVPDSFDWLGGGADLLRIPNAVVLMVVLYASAHVLMKRTVLGRYIYAVGGNPEAARLSGVPVRRVILFAYTASGLLAGLGGVVLASRLKSGSPTYGLMLELYVIAAVVVGGTSLAGGEGKVLGSLVGAFIIAVIQNGMNLMNVEPYTQRVVLGGVILLAVLLDKLKQRSFRGSA